MKFKPKSPILLIIGLMFCCSFFSNQCVAQTDTIKVMAYNVLGFGPGNCQGAMPPLYGYLKTIISYAKPDIAGLDKMQCVKTSNTDLQGISPASFPDTVIAECFDTNFSFCPFTDISGCQDGASNIIFYNHAKIGYVSTTPLYTGQEDIELYKLYYKDPNLTKTNDTTFLYVISCHTISGAVSAQRDVQDTIIINALKKMFNHTPNLILMGDFNTRTTTEPGYELITQTADTNFILNDPPFHPDAHLTYPCDWDATPTLCPKDLTTTTRITTLPNSCGTTGGGKDWYDHIFISPWLVNGVDYMNYIKNSYTTLGNDGNRIGVAINAGTNTSAPSNVINALFNFSDKYPVMVSLAVTDHVLAINNILADPGCIRINNPIENNLVIHFANYLYGQSMTMSIYDVCGRNLYQSTFNVDVSDLSKNIPLTPGVYFVRFESGQSVTTLKVVKE